MLLDRAFQGLGIRTLATIRRHVVHNNAQELAIYGTTDV